MAKIKVGDKAPDFLGETNKGKVSLKKLKGKNVVLYFYPKDNTPGCTVEANDFTKNKLKFTRNNTVVLGVSKDDLKSHDKFICKKNLKIELIADEDLKIQKSYGVWGKKKFMGREFMGTKRYTFLIDKKGVVRKIWPDVKVLGHAEDVLASVKGL